jgi:hypothetical protein
MHFIFAGAYLCNSYLTICYYGICMFYSLTVNMYRAFGTWPVATMSAGEKKVVVEGPLCSDSKVVGWFSRDFNDGTTRAVTYNTEADLNPAGAAGTRAHTIDVSGFAFNSSILWDPERWGRPTSLPDTSQVSSSPILLSN